MGRIGSLLRSWIYLEIRLVYIITYSQTHTPCEGFSVTPVSYGTKVIRKILTHDLTYTHTHTNTIDYLNIIKILVEQLFNFKHRNLTQVRYVHDGSENHQDAIVLEMELMPEAKFTLPSYLQGRNTFVLHVNITPVNDPPVMNLMPGKVLRLTQVCVYLQPCNFSRDVSKYL